MLTEAPKGNEVLNNTEDQNTPKGPEPPKGAKVLRVWRDEQGKTWLNDDGMGPGVTFDLLNWAGITVLMPFFFREMTGELMKVHAVTQRLMESHLTAYHGPPPTDSQKLVPLAEELMTGVPQGDTAASPGEPVVGPEGPKAVSTEPPGDTD